VRSKSAERAGARVPAVGVFLTVGFSFDDELEYMHLSPRGKGWGIGPRGLGLAGGADVPLVGMSAIQ